MRKRLLAFLLMLTFLFSATSMVAFANPVGFQESNVATESEWISNEEMAMMNKIGAIPWASIEAMNGRHNEVVSRWFMCYLIGKWVDLDATKPAKFETLFNDLTSEHKYYNMIKGAVKAGYMTGDDNGYFRPDEPITTMEAATVLLRVLGYQQYIDAMGFNKALNRTEILDGIPVQDSITQPMLMKMVLNFS